MRSINSLFGKRNNYLINGRSLLLYHFTRRAIKLTVVIIMGYHCYQLEFYPIFSQGEVHIETKLLGIISVGFDTIDQVLI
jgi:hypothetical protein